MKQRFLPDDPETWFNRARPSSLADAHSDEIYFEDLSYPAKQAADNGITVGFIF
ncbi:MAG TPA: hypothetical protein VN372_10120 [Methanospirillum sp.]|nr:hypothetical protein [Methanospirillum sp.]